MINSALILGCGDIGQRIAAQLPQSTIFGVRRDAAKLSDNIHGISADLNHDDLPERFAIVPKELDAVIITMTPSQRGKEGYEAAYIDAPKRALAALDALRITVKRLVFLSSTSVYGQDDGQWVDEESRTEPKSDTAKVLLQAEKVIENTATPSVIVRSSGIYGLGRDRLLRETLKGKWYKGTPIRYSNRIHQDDLAAAIVWIMQLRMCEKCYIVSDSAPETLFNIQKWIGEKQKLDIQVEFRDAVTRAGSKRLSNARLLATGFNLRYPDYKVGYSSMFDE